MGKKIFLEDLPKVKKGTNKGKIDWSNSIGCNVRFIYEDIVGEIEILQYEKITQKVYIKYNDSKDCISCSSLVLCNIGRTLQKRTNKYRVNIGQKIKDEKRDFIIINREYRSNHVGTDIKWYKYKCNKCGYDEGWISEYDLLKGNGCSCCRGFTVVEGINDINSQESWMVKYFKNPEEARLYTKSSGNKIIAKCPDCGNEKEIRISTIYRNKSMSCKKCGDGIKYPNKFASALLYQLNINFESEFSPEWCVINFNNRLRKCRYDFYFVINNKQYIIEMDGGFHKKDNNMSGQTKEESKYIDDEKDRLAKKYDIDVIRIDCGESELEYIRDNIINSKLSDIFDLSKIDWNKVEEFALSNRVKEACELWNNIFIISTLHIAEIMKINRCTATRYLKQGMELGWCNYDPKYEMRKSAYNSREINKKRVEIFKDDNSLGIFSSCAELEKQSEELFGVKISNQAISAVALGKIKQHKGFTFKYIEKAKAQISVSEVQL